MRVSLNDDLLSLTRSTPTRTSELANAGVSKKMVKAATDFESILLGQWLQEAQSTFAQVPGADDEQDSGGEQLKSFAAQALAKSFSLSGGIGLSRLVLGALEAQSQSNAIPPQLPPQATPFVADQKVLD